MAGKPYSMREMRSIVEYLVERKAYGEIRGRKMWMEFANTDKTSRTWQSLKETFLKRILPDIQNPYYKLTMDQAQSFRVGYDVAEKEKNNRLEFRTASENQKNLSTMNTDIEEPTSSKNIAKQNEINEVPASSIDEALEKATGEDTAAKIQSRCRSSADTLVLGYENAEDIRRDLESPQSNKENKTKSLKDKLIFEYSAPLTPLVKDLLDAFETESECSDKEPESKTAASIPTVEIPDSQPVPDVLENIKLEENDIVNNEADPIIEISDSDNVSNNINDKNNPADETFQKDTSSKNHTSSENVQNYNSLSNSKTEDCVRNTDVNKIIELKNDSVSYVNTEATIKDTRDLVTAETGSKTINKTPDETNIEVNTIINTGTSTQNTSSDTFLPNNQEAFNSTKKSLKTSTENVEETFEKSKLSLKRSARRSLSRENRESKKIKSIENKTKQNETEKKQVIKLDENTEKKIDKSKSILKRPTRSLSRENRDNKEMCSTENKSNQNETETIPAIELDSCEHEATPKIDDTVATNQVIAESNNTKSNSNNTVVAETSKTTTGNIEKLTTNTEKESPSTNVDEEKQDVNPKDVNPCLVSVSLFEEQFNNTIYSDCEPDDVVQPQQKQKTEEPIVTKKKKDTEDKPQSSQNQNQIAEPKTEEPIVTQKEKDIEDKPQTFQNQNQIAEPVALADKTKDAEFSNKNKIIERQLEPSKKEVVFKKPDENVTVLEDADTDKLDSGSDPHTSTKNVHNYFQNASTSINALDSSSDPVPQTKGVVINVQNAEREKAIANVFGFANGGAPSNRKRRISYRRRSHNRRRRRHSRSVSSDSSEWTSENDSDYISPPRGHRYRSTRKYLKPKGSRIIQDPEEGMLFVIIGKNIYPLIRDNGKEMNYLTYHPKDDGAETYWKQKYIDVKQREEEVKKMLKESQLRSTETHDLTRPSTSRDSAPRNTNKTAGNNNIKESVDLTVEKPVKPEPKDEKMVLKMVLKTGVECCLEGDWNQISHLMPQMVPFLHNDVATNGNAKIGAAASKMEVDREVRSGEITPADSEVHEKVNKLESEIFNKIEALDKEDGDSESETANVTQRRTRRRIESSTSSITNKSPAKRQRTSKTISVDSKQESSAETKRTTRSESKNKEIKSHKEENKASEEPLEIEKPKTRGRKRKEKIETDEPEGKEKSKSKTNDKTADSKPSSRSSSRLSKQRDLSESSRNGDNSSVGRRSVRQLRTPQKFEPAPTVSKLSAKTSKESTQLGFDDDNVRFMFPPPEGSTSKSNVKPAEKNRSLPKINVIPPIEDIISSTGYLDSDASPLKLILPKRKRVSYIARKITSNRRLARRRSLPMLLESYSTESSASSYFIPIRRSPSIQSSAESDIPLMGKQNISSSNLERIDEGVLRDTDQAMSQTERDSVRHFNSVSKETTTLTLNSNDLTGVRLEVGSSSNISMPLSPELSLVENLSISREMIKSNSHPTINEIQQNNRSGPMDYTDYMISNVDVSVPLMDQGCHFQKNNETTSQTQNNSDVVLKDCTVNLTLSKSLDQRMQNLLLESARKMIQINSRQMPMEVDQTPITTAKKPRVRNRKINVDMDADQSKADTSKKTRAKKRSSTPQKKKAVPKSKAPKDTIVEEEHMDFCCSGRQSCPPAIISVDENANNCSDVTLPTTKPKPKQKKDIIKVKIQKPGDKNGSKRKKRENSPHQSSLNTDSGIIDTESILQVKDDSVDLIHNHSETCLMSNDEHMLNSLELVENSSVSIVSLSSSRQSEDSLFFKVFGEHVVLSDGSSSCRKSDVAEHVASDDFQTAESVFQSPVISNSSLITEDLSNSPKPSKWYLLDEDISNQEPPSSSGFGSNLHQIFPIVCHVPNLSVISETSKEDSRKAARDSVKSSKM